MVDEEDGNWVGGMTPLIMALLTQSMKATQVLLNQTDIGRYIHIINYNSTSLIPSLDLSLKDYNGFNAIIYGVWLSTPDAVDMLLEAGADIDTTISKENGLLHIAAMTCKYEMAKLLIDLGMDKKAKNSDGNTPFNLAKESGCKDYVDNWKEFKKLLN